MVRSALQIDRPVLPSIQDLLSDREFDKLRLQSPKDVLASQHMALDPKALLRHGSTRPLLHHPSSSCSPSPNARPLTSPHTLEPVGKSLENHPVSRHFGSSLVHPHVGHAAETGRLSAAQQALAMMDLPTYVLTPDQCPPDDDRRHGCGICHRRFNRPSSLMIHLNSHTGAQPFKCPFPGCTRRFSVNSNMRRHYRNHREGAPMTAPAQPYPASYYRTPEPLHPYYRPGSSSPPSPPSSASSSSSSFSFSTPSSPSHTDDGHLDPMAEAPTCAPHVRERSRSTVLPTRARDRPPARPRACTVPGCHCDVAGPGALRPAFAFHPQQIQQRQGQQGGQGGGGSGSGALSAPSQSRFSPSRR